jgi:glycosyltransferase involved in cell wall biosynthesis
VRRRVALLAATSLPWHRPGGLERHVFDLCRWLRKRDVPVDLFLSTPEHATHPFAGDEGFRLRVIPGIPFVRGRFGVVVSRSTLYPLFSLRMGRAVAAPAARGEYAAVIAQGMTGLGYAAYAPRGSAPLILNPQGMEEALTPSKVKYALYAPFRALTRFAARRAAAVVATDRVLAPVVEAVLGVPRERVLVIPNAIDVAQCTALRDDSLAAALFPRLGAEDAAPRIVTVGRLAPNKGFEVGMRALVACAPRLPPSWRWIVVGEGPLRAGLERTVRELGLERHVRLVGTLSDREIHTLLAQADLFLNPTLYEGSSLVTLEAMSHGCAIVASRAGGIPDKIEEGETGWLAEPGDPGALAAAIERWAAASDEERARIRRGAAARCRERFDWPVCVDRYLEAIDRLSTTTEAETERDG